jgi:hypothetical protein
MREMMAAATLLGAANAATACDNGMKPADAGGEPPNDAGADANNAIGPPVAAVVDASITAESTLDATTFAGPDAAKQRAEAGAIPKDPGRGYRVVDPLPRPSRCDPPYTIDPATGRRKYKKECLEDKDPGF